MGNKCKGAKFIIDNKHIYGKGKKREDLALGINGDLSAPYSTMLMFNESIMKYPGRDKLTFFCQAKISRGIAQKHSCI